MNGILLGRLHFERDGEWRTAYCFVEPDGTRALFEKQADGSLAPDPFLRVDEEELGRLISERTFQSRFVGYDDEVTVLDSERRIVHLSSLDRKQGLKVGDPLPAE